MDASHGSDSVTTWTLVMDGGSRVSDFSIESILSPQLGHKLQPQPRLMNFAPDTFIHRIPVTGFHLDSGILRPPAPVRVPVLSSGSLQFGGASFGETFYSRGTDFSVYPNFVHFSGHNLADAQQPLPGYHGYHHVPVQPQHPQHHQQQQQRQKARMRTVFTDGQTKHLEALFELTDYPTVEARAEVARSTGLNEETVRVWFKNRRARRKRQRSGSKVNSPSPCAAAEMRLVSSIL